MVIYVSICLQFYVENYHNNFTFFSKKPERYLNTLMAEEGKPEGKGKMSAGDPKTH